MYEIRCEEVAPMGPVLSPSPQCAWHCPCLCPLPCLAWVFPSADTISESFPIAGIHCVLQVPTSLLPHREQEKWKKCSILFKHCVLLRTSSPFSGIAWGKNSLPRTRRAFLCIQNLMHGDPFLMLLGEPGLGVSPMSFLLGRLL